MGIYAQSFNFDAVNVRVSNCGDRAAWPAFLGANTILRTAPWPIFGRHGPSQSHVIGGQRFKRNDTLFANDLQLRMYNSVVTGNQLNELVLDSVGGSAFDYRSKIPPLPWIRITTRPRTNSSTSSKRGLQVLPPHLERLPPVGRLAPSSMGKHQFHPIHSKPGSTWKAATANGRQTGYRASER